MSSIKKKKKKIGKFNFKPNVRKGKETLKEIIWTTKKEKMFSF